MTKILETAMSGYFDLYERRLKTGSKWLVLGLICAGITLVIAIVENSFVVNIHLSIASVLLILIGLGGLREHRKLKKRLSTDKLPASINSTVQQGIKEELIIDIIANSREYSTKRPRFIAVSLLFTLLILAILYTSIPSFTLNKSASIFILTFVVLISISLILNKYQKGFLLE